MDNKHKYQQVISEIPSTAVDIYRMLPEGTRCEVIFDELSMLPSPSREHQTILIKLTAILFQFLQQHKTGTLLTAPFDVYFENEQSVVQPDLFIVLNQEQHIIKKMAFMACRRSLSKSYPPTALTIPSVSVPYMKKPALKSTL